MIESDQPDYEPVPLAEDETTSAANPNTTRLGLEDAGPITSSFRATNRLLRANGGYAAYARGFFCLLAYSIATGTLQGIFAAAVPFPISELVLLLVFLALVQLNTAWGEYLPNGYHSLWLSMEYPKQASALAPMCQIPETYVNCNR